METQFLLQGTLGCAPTIVCILLHGSDKMIPSPSTIGFDLLKDVPFGSYIGDYSQASIRIALDLFV